MSALKAKLAFEHDAQVARVALAAPKANIVDRAMMADLERIFDQLEPRRDLKAIVLGAEGPNFSYGASVEERLPDYIAGAIHASEH